MNYLDRFSEYAAAFEKTLADDNWERLEEYFTPDASYAPGDGTTSQGRDEVFETLRNSISSLDRRFDSRSFGDTPPPTVSGNVVTMLWSLIFEQKGLPSLTISGCEYATFSGNAIEKLEDVFDEGTVETLTEWMEKHGDSLG